MTTRDRYDLARFVAAQDGVYAQARDELAAGRKRSHWMWFIFPQLRGLGSSPTAQHYAIGSLGEARAYLAHPLLGARLLECTLLATAVAGRSATEVFGRPDDLKFRSSMTLFDRAAGPGDTPYAAALRRYFDGEPDALTLRFLDTLPA